MLKNYMIKNLIIKRTLLTATSDFIINKQKQAKPKRDVLKFPLFNDTPEIDLNSRLITVEGCFGVRKSEIAKKIANYFALNYYDDIKEWDIYNMPVGNIKVNFLKYNNVLPDKAKFYTTKMFWNDPDPIKNGKPLMMQLLYYYNRYFIICKGMGYLLNTGDGFVTKRSPFTDYVMALTYKELGLLSEKAFRYYNYARAQSITHLWLPNFIVYVKANPDIIRRNLKQKNSPLLDTCNFTDKFIETYQNIFENVHLPKQIGSRIFTIDLEKINIDDDIEFTYEMDRMAKLNLDFDYIDDFNPLFRDWVNGTQQFRMGLSKRYFSYARKCFFKAFAPFRIPTSVSEGSFTAHDLDLLALLMENDKRIVEYGTSLTFASVKEIMFWYDKFNFENPKFMPTAKLQSFFY